MQGARSRILVLDIVEGERTYRRSLAAAVVRRGLVTATVCDSHLTAACHTEQEVCLVECTVCPVI